MCHVSWNAAFNTCSRIWLSRREIVTVCNHWKFLPIFSHFYIAGLMFSYKFQQFLITSISVFLHHHSNIACCYQVLNKNMQSLIPEEWVLLRAGLNVLLLMLSPYVEVRWNYFSTRHWKRGAPPFSLHRVLVLFGPGLLGRFFTVLVAVCDRHSRIPVRSLGENLKRKRLV